MQKYYIHCLWNGFQSIKQVQKLHCIERMERDRSWQIDSNVAELILDIK